MSNTNTISESLTVIFQELENIKLRHSSKVSSDVNTDELRYLHTLANEAAIALAEISIITTK